MAEFSQEKQGYKYTEEFGYIPEDWEYNKLEDVFDFIAGGDVDKEHFSPYWTNECRYPIYSNTLEDEGLYGWSSKYTINKDAIAITGRGDVGHVFYHEANFTPIIRLITGTAKRKINVKSLSYFAKRVEFRNESTGVPQLTVPQVQKYMIAYPSDIQEQKKIAEVLGDIDILIDTTQKLINKKKDIKTATMQKLLTPKDDWEETTLRTLCTLYGRIGFRGYTQADIVKKGLGAITFSPSDIIDNKVHYENCTYISWHKYEESPEIKIYNGDIIFVKTASIGKLALIKGLKEKATINPQFVVLKNIKCNNVFLVHLLQQDYINQQIKNITAGSTIPTLSQEQLYNLKIFIPTKEKQGDTAAILSDMDAEIESLEKELNKYKDLKIGMMQQLLTGKIRLLNKAAEDDSNVISLENVSPKKVANDEFKDAILISILAYKFGSEQYPLGAFRRQKLSYFYKRHANMNTDEYTKKAMGPYNSKIKYQGAENIAIRNKYVKKVGNRGIVATNLISKAEEYYNRYYNSADMQWLDANFHYENNNNLEVLATVDYTINELVSQNKAITLANIKTYIASDEEWKPKLDLDYFTDKAIVNAMEKIKKLFNSY